MPRLTLTTMPEWKWNNITMDFVIGLPKMIRGNNAIWVIMDRLTKSARLISVNMSGNMEKLARLYIK